MCYDVWMHSLRRPPKPPLFPYTALFRSRWSSVDGYAGLPAVERLGLRPALVEEGAEGRRALALPVPDRARVLVQDRKSTRLNSSHTVISYAVFCMKKKRGPLQEPVSPNM